ncbi:flavin-containing monooxygenase [Nocardia brasiliensis]|uniref:flavin-containing monooxygenase n=1 Tax=Nocardia brasiliensis TaxID=37326 RepID=UPI002457BF04|nr:NAD(P)/FAD-dependent oxidoreductase [Nocardia brasiliensis]
MFPQGREDHNEGASGFSHFKVVVVGAGFGGIGMGVALKQAGINDFIVVEKGPDIGGVWRDNTYPGCSCDVPSHLYSFSFAPYRGREVRFPGQQKILEYLRGVAIGHQLLPHLRLNTSITEARFGAETGRWQLITDAGQCVVADVVIFAVGQLHRPFIPDLAGRSDFAGAAFHSARWNHEQNMQGRNVAVIGTGSSAAQMLPYVASQAEQVSVYQRTPHWVLPKPATKFGAVSRGLLRMPGAHQLYRWALHSGADILLSPIMRRGWPALPAEWTARKFLRRTVSDPTLRKALTPNYPIGAKRIIFDSKYYSALTRDNVDLVTAPIVRITQQGIEAKDRERRHHVIIYATGFRASEFLVPIIVHGRGGRRLNDQWSTGAEAFMGLAIFGYPNAFLIAGPNSFNPAGSNPEIKELQINYILKCLRWREQTGAKAIEVRADVMRHHQQWMCTTLSKTVWPSSVRSWYKHPSGRTTNPWPSSAQTFARMLRHHPSQVFTSSPEQGTAAARPVRDRGVSSR